MSITSDHLLGGLVAYRQPRDGLRASLDPVLLAAAIPARPGDRVLEAGTGAGAALLCLAARVADIGGVGLDRDPGLIRLACQNAMANDRPGLGFVVGDVAASPIGGGFDHVFANPPYHPHDGTQSPSDPRDAAKRGTPGLLPIWVEAMAKPLRHRGTLTLILPPRLLEPALNAMRGRGVAPERIFPIWPKAGQPARFVVIRGRKHGRAPLVLTPGLILHDEIGASRPEADAILRRAMALRLD